jgi:hypothetical protein
MATRVGSASALKRVATSSRADSLRCGAPSAQQTRGRVFIDSPGYALALQESQRGALSHVGIRVDSTGAVEGASRRLRESGLATLDERNTECRYARQDKVWVTDPAGNAWEVYTVLEEVGEPGGSACCDSACCAA